MCSWILTTRALALVVPATPMLAGNATNYTYLALGDSIAFGYNPLLFFPFVSESSPPPTPAQFTGYPEVVAQIEHLLQSKKEVNAACPGETSGSFISGTAPDNGCYGKGPEGQPPFKASIGLHTSYTGSQLAFAVSQLASNKHINLVTLGIGGNDLLLVDKQCTANPSPFKSFSLCVTGNLLGDATMHIPGVLQSYAANLTYILATLRAHYAGTLVLVKNYSPSADPLFIGAAAGLDQAMMQIGTPFGVKIADGFRAFQIASAPYHGDPLHRRTSYPTFYCNLRRASFAGWAEPACRHRRVRHRRQRQSGRAVRRSIRGAVSMAMGLCGAQLVERHSVEMMNGVLHDAVEQEIEGTRR